MSSYYDSENPPPPPAKSASFKQIVVMLLFGTFGSMFVVKAVQSQPGNSLYVGSMMIAFALVFFAGLISGKEIVELIASGILLLGAGGLAAIAFNTRDILWVSGTVFFILCIVVIQLKNRFKDQSDPPEGELRNPYS